METHAESGCGCGCSRRGFLIGAGVATGGWVAGPLPLLLGGQSADTGRAKKPAVVRAAFLYPPSSTFKDKSDGWWSWPGNEFDAEGRQKQYTIALREMEKKLGVRVVTEDRCVTGAKDVERLAQTIRHERPDGLLLVMFHNRSLPDADALLKVAEKENIPAILYIGLGVKHGPVTQYRRPGMYLIQSLDNMEAIEQGLRIIQARKTAAQSLILSISETKDLQDKREPFLGVTVRPVPFSRYSRAFEEAVLDIDALEWIQRFTDQARENRGVTAEAMGNATRSHLAIKRLLAEDQADGLTMNCLQRGMLKPCMSFSSLNSELIPAACENDLPAVYTQLLGQLLTGRPGFQHNPCYETEKNHYYASHCTCPTKVYGPEGPELPFLIRRFAHTNEGSCAIQVFWKAGDPVTMVRYYPGKEPALDVYAGKVVTSHAMPPAGGCTTNVEIEITDRPDACMVRGHHNLLFVGDFARRFRLFARLHKMRLAQTGFVGIE
ncbi:MAG: hypothetical protein JXQ73_31400 [Phycisphaerae bacterium]|nr:hypothetical protein [Phycisphaerae bacterium]